MYLKAVTYGLLDETEQERAQKAVAAEVQGVHQEQCLHQKQCPEFRLFCSFHCTTESPRSLVDDAEAGWGRMVIGQDGAGLDRG